MLCNSLTTRTGNSQALAQRRADEQVKVAEAIALKKARAAALRMAELTDEEMAIQVVASI